MRCAVLLLTAILATTRIGHARSVGVVVTGEEVMQSPLRAQLEMWLRGHGHEPVASPLEPDAINQLVDCFVIEDPSCAQKVVEQKAKADAILYARVEVVTSGASRDVTLTMHWFLKGQAPKFERRVCEGCSDEGLRTTADAILSSLVPIEAPKPAPAPPPVAPVKVIVVPTPVGRPSRTGPALVIGAGVAALLTGGVLYATSETDDGSRPTYRDTRPAGIGVAIGGAALIGAGIVLLLREPSDTGPAVAITGHGGIVGWTGRF